MTWVIEIDRPTPSGNKFHRAHWRVSYESKQEWLMLIRAAPVFTSIPEATGKRQVLITRYGKKLLDQDNLVAGCKGVVDCLKHWNLIINDSPDLADLKFDQQLGKPERTTIELTDIGGALIQRIPRGNND